MFAKCPAGRPGTADEVANVAELLMGDKGAFISGSTFLIDGGAHGQLFLWPAEAGSMMKELKETDTGFPFKITVIKEPDA